MLNAHTTPYNPPPAPTTAQRMAFALIELKAEDNATEAALLDLGYTQTEIDRHKVEARRIAGELFVRRVDTTADDRATQIEKAANIVAGMIECGDAAIFAKLRESGFHDTRALGLLYPEVILRTVDIVRAARLQVA